MRLEAVLADPELLETLRRIYEHERRLREKYPDKPSWWEWEIGDVGVPPWHVVKLVRYGIVERTYASSNHKYYRLVDFDGVARFFAGHVGGGKRDGRGRPRVRESELQPPRTPEIPGDLFDVIEGHEELKWLFRKSLRSTRHHILLVGPPATAKTLFLLEVARLPGAFFIDATHSTKVGLRELLLTVKPRYLLIDEIDKVRNEEFWNGLSNILETGMISYVKHGEQVSIRVDVNVYATANVKSRLPAFLLSRFEVIEMEPYDEATLERIMVRVLTKMYGKSPELARAIARLVIHELGSRDVRDAIKAAKIVDSMEDLEMYRRTKLKYRRKRYRRG